MTRSPIPPLPTHVAHSEFGANRFHGFPVPSLAGEETLTGLTAIAVGGRRLDAAERAMLDDVAVSLTLADPRVWPLKMARLVSAYGGCLPALAVGFLCVEEAVIGYWTAGRAAELLMELRNEVHETTVDSVLPRLARRVDRGESLWGFGVPFRPYDERLFLLRRRVVERGRDQLPFWRIAEAAGAATRQLKGLEPNIASGVAAVCLDLGFTPRQIGILCVTLAQVDIMANAVEGAEQAPAILRKLPDDRVRYVGKSSRQSPRAHGHDT